MSKAFVLAVVFVAACSGQKPEEKVAPPDPIVPGSKLAAPAPAPAPTPAPETGSGSAGSADTAAAPVFDEKLHDECAKKAPANLEMSGRKDWIATCMSDAQAAAKPAEKPADATKPADGTKPADTKAPAKADATPAKTDAATPAAKPAEKAPAEKAAAPAATTPELTAPAPKPL